MARRPPMKIAPSPSETPEHEAVRERERSSEAVQAKIREERASEGPPKPKRTPPAPKAAKSTPDDPAPKSQPKRKQPKPKATAVVAEPTSPPAKAKVLASEPITAPAEETGGATKRVEQRISVGVPVSLSTSNALEKAARKLGTDVDYVKRALLPKARAAFLDRAAADDLKKTSKAMKLLFDQRLDNGVALMPVKLVVDDDIEAMVRAFIPDPLDVISVNRLVAAFVGAEFEELVAAL